MTENTSTVQRQEREGEVGTYVVNEPIPQSKPPADGAEVKKPIPDAADEGTKPAAKEGEVVEGGETATPEQVEAKKQSKFQRRLDRQKTARVAAETETRLLRERLADLEAKQKPQAQAGDPQEPKREDFEQYEQYLRAVTRYDAEQVSSKALKAEREERQKAERERTSATEQQKLAKNWSEREAEFQKTTKDYLDVVQPFIEDGLDSLSEMARRAIAESELGPQLLHHLGQHDDVAESLAELSPLQQVKALGKLEDKFAKPAAKTGKVASDAPPPVSGAKPGASAIKGYSDNMTDAEYRELRKGQGARWAR